MARILATLAEAKTSLLKAEVLAHAQEWVRMVRDEKVMFCGLQLSLFAKPDSENLVIQFMKQMAGHPLGMLDLTNLARAGEPLADRACRELIIEYEHNGETMPPPLRAYNVEIADPRRVYRRLPAQTKAGNFLRDITITAIVGDLCWKFGLKPTRQPASKRENLSGCRALALALANEGMAIGESTVVSVWTRYGRIAFPNGIAALGPHKW